MRDKVGEQGGAFVGSHLDHGRERFAEHGFDQRPVVARIEPCSASASIDARQLQQRFQADRVFAPCLAADNAFELPAIAFEDRRR